MLLKVPHVKQGTYSFTGTDNEELFLKNNKLGWEFYNTEIEYKFNSHGYREAEFDTLDFTNSVVVFGCSMVASEGLPVEHSLSEQLKKRLSVPVINAGAVGTGIDFTAYNNITLAESATPVAVVNVWPIIYRYLYFSNNSYIGIGSWNIDKSLLASNIITDEYNLISHQKFLYKAVQQMWNVPIVNCTLSIETANALEIDHIETVDYARDKHHCGINTVNNIVTYIEKNLK